MNKAINLVIFISCVFSSQLQAKYINFTTEPNGPMGSSAVFSVDDINVEISAYNYDTTNNNSIQAGLVSGIDGLANERHPAGLGAAKSDTSTLPPGIDNTSKYQVEFLVFKFDKNVRIDSLETEGLGPHGTDVDYWGGLKALADSFIMTDMGVKYSVDDTTPSFKPDEALGVVSWFALGAKYTDYFNVFSIQRLNFTEEPTSVAPVPLPAAFWLFGAGLMALLRSKKG